MKKIKLIFLIFSIIMSGSIAAQNYDSVSGATQKAEGKCMNLDQFKKALEDKNKKMVINTVNEDGTPNAALYGSFVSIEDNVFAVNSMAETKTTKINAVRTNMAMLILILSEKTADGFHGAKVVLKHVNDAGKISKYRSKMEKSSEKTTFFTAEKFLIYR